ncbi:MAG: tryptophan-rich sensory protein [Verrucomicrobiae bacterium]|nr:tryptophan-rich sensory protein [Verrucomicrobiae bacterium]MCX7722344.1 tryptophan-rich sensory protein [Verrucomicrobiae bacterium]MDW7980240.1 TspO/MBR family protein [Verrucomicrobiales bacterium]
MSATKAAGERAIQLVGLILFIGTCLGVGATGGAVTATSVETWYPQLRKPSWTPPNWVFGPVWTTLYILMGTAAWLVWRKRKTERVSKPLIAFAVQLLLNLLWSVLFFGLRSPGAAFVGVLLLFTVLAATLAMFWRVNKLSGALLFPYLTWVSFAAVLNGALWWMNR